MTCPQCPRVPIVSQYITICLLRSMNQAQRQAVLISSMAWLLERHPGLVLYEGINGRPYTSDEQRAIALETGLVEELPCPFQGTDGLCTINGLGPHFNQAEEPGRPPFVFLPTAIVRMLAPNELRHLVQAQTIADAKLMLLTRNVNLPRKEMLVV